MINDSSQVFQLHDPSQPDRTITLLLRQFQGHVILSAHLNTALIGTDDPWQGALGAVTLELYKNTLQVQLFDTQGIHADVPHWTPPNDIGEGSFVLADHVFPVVQEQ